MSMPAYRRDGTVTDSAAAMRAERSATKRRARKYAGTAVSPSRTEFRTFAAA
jgi:hypothetical protein